jgi:hypothetical protein
MGIVLDGGTSISTRPADTPGNRYARRDSGSTASSPHSPAQERRRRIVVHAPWDYLFKAFNAVNFPNIFYPILIAAIVLLIGQVALYNIRTRQLHRFDLLVAMQEWHLWTGVIVFSLLIIEAVFVWYFVFVLATILIGLATFVWVRFVRFPPLIVDYNEQLQRTRFFSKEKYKHPEATIRPSRRRRRRAR